MNYDKQIPLTEEKLLELKGKEKGYYIANLANYPEGRIHLEARTHIETGFSITRNMDGYVFKYIDGESILQPENKWVVMANDEDRFPNCFEFNIAFDIIEDAVDYVYNIRRIKLEAELDSLKSIR